MVACALLWLVDMLIPQISLPALGSPLIPQGSSLLLGITCLVQFAFSKWLDSRYETGLGRNFFWMIWYPVVFWMIKHRRHRRGLPEDHCPGQGWPGALGEPRPGSASGWHCLKTATGKH
jgi:biofilm PGA synthesis N-glycosyltransferase PgaC